MSAKNVVWHSPSVVREHRARQNGHRSVVLWFTGLPSSGKSTVAHAVEEQLHHMGCTTFVLDGDNVRHGLCSDLGFSPEDRKENIRRIGEVARLFVEAGVLVLTAFISPFRADRDRVRELVGSADFIEIFCDCPVSVCEERDPKGHYQKARNGIIKDFTGISAPYEKPECSDLALSTDRLNVEECAEQVVQLLILRNIVPCGEL